jgi:hypothetical protein
MQVWVIISSLLGSKQNIFKKCFVTQENLSLQLAGKTSKKQFKAVGNTVMVLYLSDSAT